ncbi:MFS transporter [Micromonospora sp. NPDC005553]|uniref:MFS transporter n=1 Tax=Micromonospora sp. NPDC005553 TaxID=3364232 RepID=UPI0036B67C42
MCIALMAVIASVSGLNVAQPQVAVAFDASQSTVLWMINIYTLSLAALLLPLGALGDRVGRKPILLAGLALFGVASAAAGLATSSEMMIAARLFAGVGAAMIMPVTLAVITSTFPDEERSKVMGVWTGVAGGGGILGMYLSAVLVDWANWRWLFLLPVVLVAAATVTALRAVPNSRETSQHSFDMVGSLTSVIAVVALIYVLHEGPVHGWTSPVTVASLLVGVVAAIGFVAWELRRAAPLLDVRLFRDRRLASGSLALLALFGVQAGIFVVLFPYFQAVLGWSLAGGQSQRPVAVGVELGELAVDVDGVGAVKVHDPRTTAAIAIASSPGSGWIRPPASRGSGTRARACSNPGVCPVSTAARCAAAPLATPA